MRKTITRTHFKWGATGKLSESMHKTEKEPERAQQHRRAKPRCLNLIFCRFRNLFFAAIATKLERVKPFFLFCCFREDAIGIEGLCSHCTAACLQATRASEPSKRAHEKSCRLQEALKLFALWRVVTLSN